MGARNLVCELRKSSDINVKALSWTGSSTAGSLRQTEAVTMGAGGRKRNYVFSFSDERFRLWQK
jgi:hypothetical protein